jgi:glycerol-3-phosphate acyltransferase PlsX
MGGDQAPKAALEGAVTAARDFGIELVLIGDRDVIVRELADHDLSGLPITIEHAPEIVAMDESPLESVLAKPESSIHVGLELVKRGKVDGFVSAGNSGAVMAAAMAILGNLPGVDRPAIASMVPTTAGLALLIDAGANTDVKPLNLVQFAVMGSVYWRRVHHVSHPRVGVLSNGEEASKGTELTRSAAAALLQMAVHINYVGYVEGRDINRAKADVVVTDGFTGNVTLKTMEGFASFLLANLREIFGSGLLRRVLFFLFFRSRINAIRQRLDPAEYGGAPLLGVNGVAIIAHGSSNARAIRNAVRAASNEALVRHVNSEIVDILATTPVTMALKPASSKGIRGVLERMRERLYHTRDARAVRWPELYPEKKRESPERVERSELAERPPRLDRTEAVEAAPASKREGVDSSRTLPADLEAPRPDTAGNNRRPSIEKTAVANGAFSPEPSPDEGSEHTEDGSRPPKPN